MKKLTCSQRLGATPADGWRLLCVLATVIGLAALCACSTMPIEFDELKAKAVDASGFDSDQAVAVEIGQWRGVAFRLFGLPVGPAIVYLGESVQQKIEPPSK